MPKRKPPRRQRRRGNRQLMPPPVATPAAVQPVVGPALAPPPASGEAPRERSISRFSARDYSYVRRELLRIAVLAVAVFIVLIVLSFFLP
jgi:hypothetical protein